MDTEWLLWERAIAEKGITLDRPQFSSHPAYPEIVYPIDYGFVNETPGEDGDELDVFVGQTPTGLVAYERTVDRQKGDTEIKLLYNCSPAEVYLVHGFLNFAPELMSGKLVMRLPMRELWERAARLRGNDDSGAVVASDGRGANSRQGVDNP